MIGVLIFPDFQLMDAAGRKPDDMGEFGSRNSRNARFLAFCALLLGSELTLSKRTGRAANDLVA